LLVLLPLLTRAQEFVVAGSIRLIRYNTFGNLEPFVEMGADVLNSALREVNALPLGCGSAFGERRAGYVAVRCSFLSV
jgi:hypothetical protein